MNACFHKFLEDIHQMTRHCQRKTKFPRKSKAHPFHAQSQDEDKPLLSKSGCI